MAVKQWLLCSVAEPNEILARNCWGLGSSLVIQTLTNEVNAKNPILVFVAETKTTVMGEEVA